MVYRYFEYRYPRVDRVSIGEFFFARLHEWPLNDFDGSRIMGAGPQSTCWILSITRLVKLLSRQPTTEYAYEGQIYCARNLHESRWAVPISVGLEGQNFTLFVSQLCAIDGEGGRLLKIPRGLVITVYERMIDLGIDAEPTHYRLYNSFSPTIIRSWCISHKFIQEIISIMMGDVRLLNFS